MLDGFQSDAFEDIVEADRAQMDRQFSGFTFFRNHMGAFPTTIVSIPAMLTGSVYRNQEPMRRFIAQSFRKASLFGTLKSQGYRVDAVSGLLYDRARRRRITSCRRRMSPTRRTCSSRDGSSRTSRCSAMHRTC